MGEKRICDKRTPKDVCREAIVDTAVFDILPFNTRPVFLTGRKLLLFTFKNRVSIVLQIT